MKKPPKAEPSPTDPNGRGPDGRFTPGNKAATGNPYAKKVSRLRAALIGAVKPADIDKIIKVLIREAKTGDVSSIRELLDRVLGKPTQTDVLERIERLEQQLLEENET